MPFESNAYTAECMPLAVWAKIFSYLKPCWGNVTSRSLRSVDEETRQSDVTAVTASQSQSHHLKLVCRRFNQGFKELQSLSDQPILVQTDSASLVPSFQLWLKEYGDSVKSVISLCNEAQQDMVFGMLSSHMPDLISVYFWQPSRLALNSLSALTSVTICKLVGSQDKSLMALKALTSLECLVLEDGIFFDVPIATSSKHFHTTSSRVHCAEGLSHPQNLQGLLVMDSVLSGLHDLGLVACTALHSLTFGMCLIHAAQPANSFSSSFAGAFAFPAILTSLQQLAVLDAFLVSNDGAELSTDWLYGLTSLQHVIFTFKGSASLSAELTQLTSLVSFEVTTTGEGNRTDLSKIRWKAMQMLERLEVIGPAVFGKHIADVTLLPKLDFLGLCDIHPAGNTAVHFLG